MVHDDPSLTVRHVDGRQPLRLVLDRQRHTPDNSTLYNDGLPTLLFTNKERHLPNVEQVLLTKDDDPLVVLLQTLHQRVIRSVLVEGGAELLAHFIHRGLWDEARVITGAAEFHRGTKAPTLPGAPIELVRSGADSIAFHLKQPTPAATWAW